MIESGSWTGLRASGGQDEAEDQGGADADQGHREDAGDPCSGTIAFERLSAWANVEVERFVH